jgi:CBS domain-containing membrane protein
MSTDIASVKITQSIKYVSEIIDTRNIRHVPVVSGDEVIGGISKTALQKISFVNNMEGKNISTEMYDALSIDQIMTKDLMTVQSSDTIHQVADIVSQNEFHALPVVENKKLVGIVTTTDLIKYLVEQF